MRKKADLKIKNENINNALFWDQLPLVLVELSFFLR